MLVLSLCNMIASYDSIVAKYNTFIDNEIHIETRIALWQIHALRLSSVSNCNEYANACACVTRSKYFI